jgi:signal transduction histidine kinase
LALAIGDRHLIETSRYRLLSRKALLGHRAEALEELSNHLQEMVEVRGIGGLHRVLQQMTDTCCELGWHDRMQELTRLSFLVLHSAGASADRARVMAAADAVDHAVLRAIDCRFNGGPTELALALADLQPTLERSRRMLQAVQARYFLAALLHYEPIIAWLMNTFDETQAEALIRRAEAGPTNDDLFRFYYVQLTAGLVCIDRRQDERAGRVLESTLAETRPGDFILQSTCYTLLAGVWARLAQWEAAFRCLEQAERVRTRRRDQSLQSRVNHMIGQFRRDNLMAIGFVGHDLRSPLSAIQAIAQMPSEHPGAALNRIGVLAAKALDYTDGYLRFVELQLIDHHQFEAVDLRDVLDDVVEELKVAGDYRQLHIDMTEQTALVRSHFPTVRRIFANLLHNAAEASACNGRLHIDIAQVGADAVVAVHDNGSGIPVDRLPTLFDDVVFKGSRVDSGAGSAKRRGHGLGLRFVARAVRALNGTVFASNRPEGGASVYVALPLAETPAMPPEHP